METSNTQEYKYGVAFYLYDDPNTIVHVVLFSEPPSRHDYFHLGVELATDKEFGLMKVAHKLAVRDATEEDIKEFTDQIIQ